MDTVTIAKKNLLNEMQEKITSIGSSVYIQWGLVVSLIALTAFFVEFKVNTLNNIHYMEMQLNKQEEKQKDFERNYPTKEWMEAKLESIRIEINRNWQKSN